MESVIHWFRRDLRITDNTALAAAVACGGTVTPVYVLSDWEGVHSWTGANRQGFLCGCLEALAGNLSRIGGRLIVRQGEAVAELERLVVETRAGAIFFNRDPDPFGRAVEDRVREMARRLGIEVRDFKDVCMHERDEVPNGSGLPFRVFTPYSKAWLKLAKPGMSAKPKAMTTPVGVESLGLPGLATWGLGAGGEGVVAAGERAARGRMLAFVSDGLALYGGGRDLPGAGCTSRMSQDLRFGLLSIRELYDRCLAQSEALPAEGRDSARKYVSELIWREFYMQILWHFPDVLKNEFNPKFRGMQWPGDVASFERWKAGETWPRVCVRAAGARERSQRSVPNMIARSFPGSLRETPLPVSTIRQPSCFHLAGPGPRRSKSEYQRNSPAGAAPPRGMAAVAAPSESDSARWRPLLLRGPADQGGGAPARIGGALLLRRLPKAENVFLPAPQPRPVAGRIE